MKNKKRIFLPLFIAFIMIASVFGIIIGGFGNKDETNRYEYNNYQFVLNNGNWITNINEIQLVLTYGPKELEDVNFDFDANQIVNREKIYYSVNMNDSFFNAERDLVLNLRHLTNINKACLADMPGCSEFPIKSCNDVNEQASVIIMQIKEEKKVEYSKGCLMIQGSSLELTKIVDKFVLRAYGVI